MNYPDVTDASKALLDQGVRVLQGNRFALNESTHIAKLIEYMRVENPEKVADMGCGFGQISLEMGRMWPEAHFYLVNTNEFQLSECPAGPQFSRMLCDMCETSIPRYSCDLVMFNYSLCHVDPDLALWEAARIARSGAQLFVYDYQRLRGDNGLTKQHLAANFMYDFEFRANAILTGWYEVETIQVDGDDTLFRIAMGDDVLYDLMFNDLHPVIWKARR